MRAIILASFLFVFCNCTDSSGKKNKILEQSDSIMDNEIVIDSGLQNFDNQCGLIDSLDFNVFKVRDSPSEQNTYSRSTILDTNGDNALTIGRYLLFEKNIKTGSVVFNGKLLTEFKNGVESTILFAYFQPHVDLMENDFVGESREVLLAKYGSKLIEVNRNIMRLDCFENVQLFFAFNKDQTIQCISIFNLAYASYFNEILILDFIDEALEINQANLKL